MPALLVARVQVNDPDAYKDYMVRSGPAVAAYGGRFIVRGTTPEFLEGEGDGLRTVVVEFPDMETARRWHSSPEYTDARSFRTPPVAEAMFMLFETAETVGTK